MNTFTNIIESIKDLLDNISDIPDTMNKMKTIEAGKEPCVRYNLTDYEEETFNAILCEIVEQAKSKLKDTLGTSNISITTEMTGTAEYMDPAYEMLISINIDDKITITLSYNMDADIPYPVFLSIGIDIGDKTIHFICEKDGEETWTEIDVDINTGNERQNKSFVDPTDEDYKAIEALFH